MVLILREELFSEARRLVWLHSVNCAFLWSDKLVDGVDWVYIKALNAAGEKPIKADAYGSGLVSLRDYLKEQEPLDFEIISLFGVETDDERMS